MNIKPILNNGYIYIRQHSSYNNNKICKLGKLKIYPIEIILMLQVNINEVILY